MGGDDETDVDGLLVFPDSPDPGKGFLHAHVLLQIHKLGGHDASGRILRIVEILVDQSPGLRRGGAHDTLDHVGGKLLHHVDRVVHVQFLNDPGQFRVGHGVDDALLVRHVEVREHVGRRLLGEQTEHHRHAVVFNSGEELRHVKLVHLFHALLECAHAAAVQKSGQLIAALFLNRLIVHGFILNRFAPRLVHEARLPRIMLKQCILSSIQTEHKGKISTAEIPLARLAKAWYNNLLFYKVYHDYRHFQEQVHERYQFNRQRTSDYP